MSKAINCSPCFDTGKLRPANKICQKCQRGFCKRHKLKSNKSGHICFDCDEDKPVKKRGVLKFEVSA